MDNLWAPWRMAFINQHGSTPGCIFCNQPKAEDDAKHHILYRGELCFMMLNLFPYNNGHLMIAPYAHITSIVDMDTPTLTEMMSQAQIALKAIKQMMNPDGFNMGINQGHVAGAGFEHVHYHVVPRWSGDTNFMPVLADVRVIPEHIDTIYKNLKQYIAEVTSTA